MASKSPAVTADDLATIREEAASWVVCLDEAGPGKRERLQAECEAWQAGDPRRGRVFAQMQRMWVSMRPGRRRGKRRAGVLGTLLVLVLAGAQLPWSVWTADHWTTAGRIREVTLPDGSTMVLNSATAVNVDYDASRRVVRLVRGELMADVREDPTGRPFSVEVPDGRITALGTRYSVRRADGHSIVTVYESSVSVAPRHGGHATVTVAAGRRARLSPGSVTDMQPTDRRMPDWVNNRLVFNDASLDEIVARLSRHRRGWLVADDGLSGRGLRFTGVLPTGDSDAALSLLAASLDLYVLRVTPYFVRLSPRE